MSGIAGYQHGVGPEDTQIKTVDIKTNIQVLNSGTITVEVVNL